MSEPGELDEGGPRPDPRHEPPRVAVVGPCASGKTTLVAVLRSAGWDARQPAQEHSGVPDMWRRMLAPDALVFLAASEATLRAHRPTLTRRPGALDAQRARLAHARRHADLVLAVDGLDAAAVASRVLGWLETRFGRPTEGAKP